MAIQSALSKGLRGLDGGSSLAQPLAERRGARNPKALPRVTIKQIRAWARAYFSATGHGPTAQSGPIAEAPAPGDTWLAIDLALRFGHRGVPGGQSLARVRPPARHQP